MVDYRYSTNCLGVSGIVDNCQNVNLSPVCHGMGSTQGTNITDIKAHVSVNNEANWSIFTNNRQVPLGRKIVRAIIDMRELVVMLTGAKQNLDPG